MLALYKREFVYKFNFKVKQQPLTENLVNMFDDDLSDINKLKEFQSEAIAMQLLNL